MFEVVVSHKAEKGLDNAEPKMQARIFELVDELKTNPVPADKYDGTKISGSDSNYRVRLGRYRVLYYVGWNEKQVKVYDIDRKKDRTYD